MAKIDYKPSLTISKFIRDYIPNELFFSFVVGAYGSAKTTGALFKIPYMAAMQKKSEIDGIRRSRVVVVRNTAPQLRDTTISSWNYWFKDGEAGKWHATRNTFMLKFSDVECEVMFRALDTPSDVSRVLSLEVTFAVLDEFVQIPSEIVEALSGRCGRYPPKIEGGATNFGMWGASNPGEEDTWWYKFLIEDKPSNVAYFHQPSGLSDKAENLENLPNKYYENLAKGKSHSWIMQFIHAEWGYSVAGTPVVPTFNRDLHVSNHKLTPDPYLPLVIGFDPGMHSALVFGQVDMFGRACILDELALEGYGAERMIRDKLLPMVKNKYAGMEVIIAPDPAGNSRTPTNEATVIQLLKDPKYKTFWSVSVDNTNLIAPRLEAIEHFTTRLTEKGPALVVCPSVKGLIRALVSGWRYVKTQKGEEKATPEKNLSSHTGDAFGYFCRYHVRNEARYGKKAQANRRPLPTFNNPYIV